MAQSRNRVGGVIELLVNGTRYSARGNWTYSAAESMREAVVGADRVHGFTEKPTVPYIEGELTDRGDFDLAEAAGLADGTVVLRLANGKGKVLRNAWAAGEWVGNTEEGNVSVRFEGLSIEDV